MKRILIISIVTFVMLVLRSRCEAQPSLFTRVPTPVDTVLGHIKLLKTAEGSLEIEFGKSDTYDLYEFYKEVKEFLEFQLDQERGIYDNLIKPSIDTCLNVEFPTETVIQTLENIEYKFNTLPYNCCDPSKIIFNLTPYIQEENGVIIKHQRTFSIF